MAKQSPNPPGEQELGAAIMKAAEQPGRTKKVPEEILRGMRDLRRLMERSLRSKTRTSGPP
jgi:hypothetical protein